MSSSLARLDLSRVYPELVARLRLVLEACDARGACYVATTGYRDPREQKKLWAQGRTTEGPVVTQARPFESAHQWGLAVDLAREIGGRISWDVADYAVLGEEATRHGLVWGGHFGHPDAPHVNWPGFVTGADLLELKRVWDSSPRLDTVWAYVTAYSPTMPCLIPPEVA